MSVIAAMKLMNMKSSNAFADAVKALALFDGDAVDGTTGVEVDGVFVAPDEGGFVTAGLVVRCVLAGVVVAVAGCAKAVPDGKLVGELSLDGETAADCDFRQNSERIEKRQQKTFAHPDEDVHFLRRDAECPEVFDRRPTLNGAQQAVAVRSQVQDLIAAGCREGKGIVLPADVRGGPE
jgi:hypothetical protein